SKLGDGGFIVVVVKQLILRTGMQNRQSDFLLTSCCDDHVGLWDRLNNFRHRHRCLARRWLYRWGCATLWSRRNLNLWHRCLAFRSRWYPNLSHNITPNEKGQTTTPGVSRVWPLAYGFGLNCAQPGSPKSYQSRSHLTGLRSAGDTYSPLH